MCSVFIFTGVYERHLIVKRQIDNLERRQLFRSDLAFANEIIAYCSIVPKLKEISYSDDQKLPFVECLYAGSDCIDDIIVLEDLKPLGYHMSNRLKGLDYQHCKIVLQVN